MSALHINPEGRFLSPADHRLLKQDSSPVENQSPHPKDQEILLQRISDLLDFVKNENIQSAYIHQLEGLKSSVLKKTISVNDAYQIWFEINVKSSAEVQKLEPNPSLLREPAKSPNPLSRLLKTVFG